MAYLFGLAVECNEQKERAVSLLNHFANYQTHLSNGQTVSYSGELHEERSPNGKAYYWVFVFANEFKSGATKETADLLSEVGQSLLDRLRTAPPFRFAIIGVEPLEAMSFEQLGDALTDLDTLQKHYPGIVISENLIPKDRRVDAFQLFAPGYLWIPYRGERNRQ
ncbi:MAG: hypothetical protein NVS4B11_11600 [Ktedonobacteraceae bacterium]